jgi:hypothetical protein
MLKLIIKGVLFVLVVLLVDKVFLPVKYLAPEYVEDKRLGKLFEGGIQKELIILGSSRGQASIASWTLQDSLGLSTYNLAFGGSDILWHLFALESLLEKSNPPKVIVEIMDDPFYLTQSLTNGFRLDLLYPLVKYPQALEVLIEREEKDWLLAKLLVTHQLSKSTYDFRTLPVANDTVVRFGAKPGRGKIKEEDKDFFRTETTYDVSEELLRKRQALEKFQAIAKRNNIQVFYAIPPSYKPLNQEFVRRMKRLIPAESALFVYDEGDTNYRKDSLFSDPVHMNVYGAEYFTKDLVRFMRPRLRE